MNEERFESQENSAQESKAPTSSKKKLPVIIDGAVALVAVVAAIIVIVLSGGKDNGNNGNNGNNNAPICKHDDATKIVAVEAVAPTCQSTGLTEGMKCTLCDTMVVPQMVVEKIDCIEGDWIIDKESTKVEEGKRHTECTMCHKKFKEETIPAGSKGLSYSASGKECSITGIGTCTDAEVVIPSKINGLTVTSIGDEAFYWCTSLTSIVIPDSVTSIGSYALRNCTSLTSVVIGDGVTSIGYEAFSGCGKLAEVINHSSLNIVAGSDDHGYIGSYAIEVHTGASKIVNYNDYLFYTCGGVNYLFGYVGTETNLVLPENYNGENYVINDYAFYYCTSLTSVVIPDSVTSIGRWAFCHCDSLTSVVIPDSVTSISDYAFSGCKRLTSIEVDTDNANYTSIDGNLYTKDKKALIQYAIGKENTGFTIPSGVTSIGSYAFYNCISFTSVVIPDSVTSIADGAFYGCKSLASIEFNGTKAQWNSISKGSGWNYNTGKYTVYCTDGEIKK